MQLKWPETGSVLLVAPLSQAGEGYMGEIAFEHAKKVLCEKHPDQRALFDSGSHPDFYNVQPETDSGRIKIDKIRDLIDWAVGKPQIATKKIAVILPAHALNLQAANALLKTLEEPSSQTLFILVTDKPSFIPATVRSRCFWIRVRDAIKDIPTSELKETMVKDLEALQSKKNNPISIGAEWIKQDPKEILNYLLVILIEKITKLAKNNQLIRNLRWWEYLDNVFKAKRALEEAGNPNVQLLIESLLIEYLVLSKFAP